MLQHAAAERQRLFEREPNLALPERQHGVALVGEEANIDVLLR